MYPNPGDQSRNYPVFLEIYPGQYLLNLGVFRIFDHDLYNFNMISTELDILVIGYDRPTSFLNPFPDFGSW